MDTGAPPVTFTLDVEEHGADQHHPRATVVTHWLLETLAARGVRGTIFFVGELAAREPGLVRAAAAGGHEVGLHAWSHVGLPRVAPARLRDDLARGKDLLEDLSGAPVLGFRAPTFSLVPDSAWAVDLLAELGFAYSSSVLPARSPLYGWPGRPRVPHRWPNGLLELPCPVTGVGRVLNPYLGGVYFRVLPWPAVRLGLRRADPDELLWLYCHPYDFDPDEPYSQRDDVGRLANRLLWLNRSRMLARVERLLAHGAAPPLAERAARLADTLT